jgi:hypothetical protein
MAGSWDHLRHGRTWIHFRRGRVVGPLSTWPGRGSTLDIAGCGSTPGHGRAWVHSRNRRVVALSAMAGWLHCRLAVVWSHVAAIAAGPVFFSSGKFALLWRWLVWQVCPGSSDSSRPTTSRPGGPSGGRPLRVTVRTPSPKDWSTPATPGNGWYHPTLPAGWSHPAVLAGWSRPAVSEGWSHRSVMKPQRCFGNGLVASSARRLQRRLATSGHAARSETKRCLENGWSRRSV